MKNNETAVYALEALMKAGADKAACCASIGRKDEFNVEANEFSLMRTLLDNTLYLKAIKDGRKGVATVNKLDKNSIDKAVADCITLIASALPDDAEDIAEKSENKSFDQNIGGGDLSKLFAMTKDFVEQIRDEYSKIILKRVISNFNSTQITFVNSRGVEFNEDREFNYFSTYFSAKDGEKISSANGYNARFASLDKPFMDFDMHRTLLSESELSLDPQMVDGKFIGKVIVTPGSDMILRPLLKCFLSEWSLIEGTSRWKDALNTKVADTKLTIRTAPLHLDIVAGERVTNDGYESQDTDIIRDGVLKSFNLSLYGARKTGKPRALNTAFWTLDVAAGDTPLEEMIKSVDRGILLNRFSGASPGPSGDVSGVAKNSFLIENGTVNGALKETMVSFNIVDVIANITAISRERCCEGMTILPWCCFDGITISGK
ncbi:MAG: hypothetical protein LBH07_06595 [Treponema sp.]|jgi:PmbA protein|nr:hypothetical protein [Treponema sp.]